MTDGTVRCFDPDQGLGVIDYVGSAKTFLVRARALGRSGLKTLTAGQRVRFEMVNHRDVVKSLAVV